MLKIVDSFLQDVKQNMEKEKRFRIKNIVL